MNWNRFKLILVVFLAVSTVVGCTRTYVKKVDAERELLKSYAAGITYYARIHDKMISFKYGKSYRMYKAKETYEGHPDYPSVVKDDRWIELFKINGDCILFKEKNSWFPYRTGWYYSLGIQLKDCNRLTEYPWVQVFTKTPSFALADSAKAIKRGMWWSRDKYGFFMLLDEKCFEEEGSFSSELIYTGRERDTIFLLYREYPAIRQASTPTSQQLKYNIEASSIIYFKSLKIEVLKATDEGITFRVLSDEDVPWMRID